MSNRDQSGAVSGVTDHPRKGQPAHSESRRRFMKSVGMSSLAAATSGAGLGLAIAREQANLLNAELIVDNRDGGGARFIVEIPVTNDGDDL